MRCVACVCVCADEGIFTNESKVPIVTPVMVYLEGKYPVNLASG